MNIEENKLIKEAIRKGFWVVNCPVFVLLFAPALIVLNLPENTIPSYYGGISLVSGFILGWLWWSYSVPKWRLWAVSYVNDVESLIVEAIESNLMWPPGHFFQKTEINSSGQKDKLRSVLSSKLDMSDPYNIEFVNDLTK